MVAVSVLAVLLAGGAAWLGAVARERLEERVLSALAEKAGVYLDVVLRLRRKGTPARDLAEFLPGMRDAVAEASRELPDHPLPYYHQGRLYRALMDFARAEEEQGRALARCPDFAPSLYERAVLRARRYARRVDALRDRWLREEGQRLAGSGMLDQGGLGGERMRPLPASDVLAAQDREGRELRASVAADLARLARVPPGERRDPPGCAEGLTLAYTSTQSSERERARGLLRAAIAGNPRCEEAYEALAELELGQGKAEEAIAVYSEAVAIDRGYVAFWTGRAAAREARGALLMDHHADPSSLLAGVLSDFGMALELDPACAATWRGRGDLRAVSGKWEAARGGDPEPLLEAAITDYGKALELDPAFVDAWTSLAGTRVIWGTYRSDRGLDPSDLFSQAVSDYGSALALDIECAEAWMNRGLLRMNHGIWRRRHGQDPGEGYREALADFGAALKLDPYSPWTWANRGLLRMNWGISLERRGEDPGALYAEAIADYGRALELGPEFLPARVGRGRVRTNERLNRVARGRDEESLEAGAMSDFDQALVFDPSCTVAWFERGRLKTSRGMACEARGEDPGPSYAAAIADFDQAVALASDAPFWSSRGDARANWARYQMTRGEEPESLVGLACSDYAEALKLDPGRSATWMNRADLRSNHALHRMQRGEDPGALFESASQDYDQALALAPTAADAWLGRGHMRSNWSSWRRKRGEDPTAFFSQALADLDRAVMLAPGNARARRERGWVHFALEHWAEAVADFATAAGLRPDFEPSFRDHLADARKRLNGGTDWQMALQRGSTAAGKGRYGPASEAFAQGLRAFAALPEAERTRRLADPADRRTLMIANHDLACTLSQRSVGGPASPTDDPAADAPALRDRAFECIREAIRLGEVAADLERDLDLAPLREDPRWRGILDEARGGRK